MIDGKSQRDPGQGTDEGGITYSHGLRISFSRLGITDAQNHRDVFGAAGGFFLCLFGILLGTVCVFYLVKFIGKPLVNVFVSEDKFKKFKILNDETKLEALVFILFLIPGTPKDVLTYMVPLTKIPPLRFFIIATFARMPSVIGSTVVGGNLGKGDWFWAAAIFIGAAAIGLTGIFMHQKIMDFIKKNFEK